MNANQIEVTKEEEEVFKTMAEMGLKVPGLGEPLPNQLDPQKIIDEMVAQFSISLNLLLTTVIKEGAGKGNSLNAQNQDDQQSLQECVNAVLGQAEWFKEMVEERVETAVEEYIDGKDFDYEISNAVGAWFDDFNLGDYTDIDEVVERAVEDKLGNASINVEFN